MWQRCSGRTHNWPMPLSSVQNAVCTHLVYLVQQCRVFGCCATVDQVLLQGPHESVETAATLDKEAVTRSTLRIRYNPTNTDPCYAMAVFLQHEEQIKLTAGFGITYVAQRACSKGLGFTNVVLL